VNAPARVLVVDDEPAIRHILSRMLTIEGYAVTTAADVAGARDELAGAAYDVVLCDITMPGESGLDLLAELGSRDDCAVIMVTGASDVRTVQPASDNGAFGYITKPFMRNDVVVSVASAILRLQLASTT
jgi:DNA-binding NtrC family response regulator